MRCLRTAFRKRAVKRAEGFTLLELLVASALFVTFTTLLMQAFNMGFASIKDLETVNLAYYLAGNKMETLINKPYDEIVTEAKADIPDFEGYETEVVVSYPQDPNTKLKKVVLNLTFPKHGGGTRNVWLKTLVVDN